MRNTILILSITAVLVMSVPQLLFSYENAEWTKPFPPFRIVGNLYYVGTSDLAVYLIATPKGHILINSTLEKNVPHIRSSIKKLGFKFSDVKVLLLNHAHFDHCAASATIKTLTGAKYMVMEGDVGVVESGGKEDFAYGDDPPSQYAPAKVDRVLHDGDEVRLGDALLVARHTPGHTKGCTTWTTTITDNKKVYKVVIFGGAFVNPGYKLINNAKYPNIASDYEHTFSVLKALPCDIFLGAHGSYYNMQSKHKLLSKSARNGKTSMPEVFVDPAGFKECIAVKEEEFKAYLANEKTKR